MEIFAKIIKELREERGLNKTELANALGLKHPTIVNWENGSKVPSIFTFIELANFFGVTIDYLVGREK